MSKRVDVTFDSVEGCPYRHHYGCHHHEGPVMCMLDDDEGEPPTCCPLPDVVPIIEQGYD